MNHLPSLDADARVLSAILGHGNSKNEIRQRNPRRWQAKKREYE